MNKPVTFLIAATLLCSSVSLALSDLKFATVAEAVQYVSDENNIVNYKGGVFGEQMYPVTLPSGKTINNWVVDCCFSKAFYPFGKEAIPALIDLLGSDVAYLRIGAFGVLEQKAGRYDTRSLLDAAQRQRALADWKVWWEHNKDNPRLDSPPKRVYPAEDWKLQRVQ